MLLLFLSIASLSKSVRIITGRQVNFRKKLINEVDCLLDADMEQFYAKSCAPGTWMVDILYARK